MLERITPLILTYNEAPNIARTLRKLEWAKDIVIVDSFSQDGTEEIASGFPQVRVFHHVFDSHQEQWNFGLNETQISSDWVLALDADYVLTDGLVEELRGLAPPAEISGYRTRFIYCVRGRPLRQSAYPPAVVLFRCNRGAYRQDGHTQRLDLEGRILTLESPILHDDRKSLNCWLQSQVRYARLEAEKLLKAEPRSLGWAASLRRWRIFAAPAMLVYCLFVRGGILDGRAGVYYAFQRTLAELMLSLFLIDRDLGLSKTNASARFMQNAE